MLTPSSETFSRALLIESSETSATETTLACGRDATWRARLLPRPPSPMTPTVTAEFASVVAAETDSTVTP